jgi:basic amino acid/polyamine antiporter, APA family
MGDAVRNYDSYTSQETLPGADPADGEELFDPRWSAGNRLRRTFRKRDGIALIVSNVVGVGIFTTPALIANLVPNPTAMLALWIVGGGLALAGAASYAKLANLWPTAGGEYVYLSKAYGPTAGFLSGWTSLIAGFSGSVAASAVALVLFAGQYFPGLAADRSVLSLDRLGINLSLSPRILAAASVIALFAVLHICSLAAGKITQNTLAIILVGMVVIFVGRGFATGNGSWSHFHSSGAHFGTMNWLLALIPVMFTYSGWNAAAYVSEEIHASRRSMRPVLLGGTCIVIALYTVLNALYLYAIPAAQMRSASNVADAAAHALFGTGSQLVTPALIVALLGAVSAMTIAGPRVYFAMARDGAFIPAFARTSRKFGTPALAIALQAMWSIALVMLGGFDQILMYTGFAIVLSSGAAVAGLFVVQRRSNRTNPIKRARFLVPGVFVLASAALVVDTVLEAPKIALIGVLLIAAGIPVYAMCRRSSSARLTLQPEEAAGD